MVRDANTMEVKNIVKLQKRVQALKCFKTSCNLVYIALNDEFVVISQEPGNAIVARTPLSQPISDMQISQCEDLLGVAYSGNETLSPKIEIYGIQKEKTNPFEQYIWGIEKFSDPISKIDISLSAKYIMIQTSEEDVAYFNINAQKMDRVPQSTEEEEAEVEWCGEGPSLSEKKRGIQNYYYSDQNKMTSCKILHSLKTAVVTDEIGTVRLFNYPLYQNRENGADQLRCYAHHLCAVTFCALSPDSRKVLTASRGDRSWILWDVLPTQADEQ